MPSAVFLLHGIFGTKRNYKDVERYLHKKGVKTYPYEYKDHLGKVGQHELAKEFAEFVKKTGEDKFCIFAISQGAIIAAIALEEFGLNKKCTLLIAMNAPFYGTYLAHFSKNEGIASMRRGSAMLSSLREKIEKSNVRYVTIWNPLDMVVVPGNSAKLPTAHKVKRLSAPFHVTYSPWLIREFVFKEVMEVDS